MLEAWRFNYTFPVGGRSIESSYQAITAFHCFELGPLLALFAKREAVHVKMVRYFCTVLFLAGAAGYSYYGSQERRHREVEALKSNYGNT